MLKNIGKYIFMIELGFKYINIFKKTFFHPFISIKQAYRQLSKDRQAYSNDVLGFLNIEVETVGSIPSRDKILYAINHRSLLDIIVMESVFCKHHKNGAWIAKQELFDAFYGDFFKFSGCIGVDLEHGKGLLKFYKSLKKILNKVDDLNIYIFPEGERYKGKGIADFQSGAEKIAKANGLDIVPVYIDDTLESVFKDAPYAEKRVVKVYIGDVIIEDDLNVSYKALLDLAYKGKEK